MVSRQRLPLSIILFLVIISITTFTVLNDNDRKTQGKFKGQLQLQRKIKGIKSNPFLHPYSYHLPANTAIREHGLEKRKNGLISGRNIEDVGLSVGPGGWKTINKNNSEVRDSFCTVSRNLSVYSAFFDDITGFTKIKESLQKVRIIAIDDAKNAWEGLECEYMDQNGNHLGTESAKKINSTYGDAYGLSFILCDYWWWNIYDTIPYYVRLDSNSTNDIQPCLMKIHYHHHEIQNKHNVAACVQPLHSNFENPVGLLEWIEFNRLMGVTHFTFYNHSIGPVTSVLLSSYDPQVVSVMKWDPPVYRWLRVYGQFVAASDCAHRYRGIAKYVVTFDTDEFLIVPPKFRDYFNYFEMLWKLKEKKARGKISFVSIVSNVSFRGWLQRNASSVSGINDKSSVAYHRQYAGLVQQLSIPWRSDFLPAGQTKFVMRPERILESGVHWAQVQVNGTANVRIQRDEGFYFHFRECSSYYHVPNAVLLNGATCTNSTGKIETDEYAAKTFGGAVVKQIIYKIEKKGSLKKLILEYVENNPSQTRFRLD